MRWRPLHLAVLAFQVLWLNVIVPGHQRGAVQLPGATAAPASCPACCCDHPNAAAGRPAHGSKPDANHGSPANCALCFFAAHLSVPPTIDLTPAPLDLLHRIRPDASEDLVARVVLLPFDGRGPPQAA